MQKISLTVICFFLPIFIFQDFNPALHLILVGILYEAKATIGLMLLSLLAGFWSVKAFFKLLFGGLRFKHFIELAITIGICCTAFTGVKYKFKNLHQRPLRLLQGEIFLIPDFQRVKSDWQQAKKSFEIFRRTIQSLRIGLPKTFNN
ncbi:hypothetical protein E0I61_09190 [Flavobacterium ranwuense]|uniref:Uncharacterized protein n=1 Tax=Flavobacterium ranwuense TaxID=2541725 RepID=A0ABY2DRD9_9FLAO|nr:hypothetical protein [Flavobacterium ranwuense]TDE29326.1 hypothetical protein E0I61_09190 [Flavobacterium ranwuense]